MRIAILTSGILPVPAVQGGAVENLVDFYLEYNDQHKLHDITVYSVWHPDVAHHPALQSEVNHYRYITVHTWWAKLKKKYHQLTHGEEYYHYTIEYFLHEAMKHLCQQDYDIIILENRPGYALKIPQKYPAKIVYHIHNDFLNAETLQAQGIYDRADGIITVSEYIRQRILTINSRDKKCKAIPNGINLKAFSHQLTADRGAIGLGRQDMVLLYSGRINKEKGIMELIEAMNLLKDHTQIKLLVIGSSFYGNVGKESHFITALKEKAASLADRIIFTGFVPYSKMPKYISMADIAVIPSNWDDPFPTTVLEAQAMGKPIIATRRGGIPEEVTAENAILLHTDENFTENLAKAILDLYQHPEKRKAMSKASIEQSRQFSKERYAKDFFDAIASFSPDGL